MQLISHYVRAGVVMTRPNYVLNHESRPIDLSLAVDAHLLDTQALSKFSGYTTA